MNLIEFSKSTSGSAKSFIFRAALFAFACMVLFAPDTAAQTKSSTATTKKTSEPQRSTAILPKVAQVDDARLLALLKPKGKPLLVNFWATWCVPCREEFPDLVEIDTDYRGRLDVLTVSLDFVEEIDTSVPKFLSEMKAEMPTYLLVSEDESNLIASIAKDWSGGLPFTILYNEKGEIAYFKQGKFKTDLLRAEIDKLLPTQAKQLEFKKGFAGKS